MSAAYHTAHASLYNNTSLYIYRVFERNIIQDGYLSCLFEHSIIQDGTTKATRQGQIQCIQVEVK